MNPDTPPIHPYEVHYKRHMDDVYTLNIEFQKWRRVFEQDHDPKHLDNACESARRLLESYDTWHESNPAPDEVKFRPHRAWYPRVERRQYYRAVEEERETRLILNSFLDKHRTGFTP